MNSTANTCETDDTSLSAELKRKAQWVADLMQADKVTPEMVTPEMALAYMDEAGRRIATIQNIYLTHDGAKEAMRSTVLSGLT